MLYLYVCCICELPTRKTASLSISQCSYQYHNITTGQSVLRLSPPTEVDISLCIDTAGDMPLIDRCLLESMLAALTTKLENYGLYSQSCFTIRASAWEPLTGQIHISVPDCTRIYINHNYSTLFCPFYIYRKINHIYKACHNLPSPDYLSTHSYFNHLPHRYIIYTCLLKPSHIKYFIPRR